MTTDLFWETLSLHPASDLEQVERRFLDVVKERIQVVSEKYDEGEIASEEQWLRNFHHMFFQFALTDLTQRLKDNQAAKKKDHPEAPKLKIAARGVLESLQNNIVEFALCYMHINRYMVLLREEIKHEELKATVDVPLNAKWTSDVGIAISRYKGQKKSILQDIRRMKDARGTLETIEKDLITLRTTVTELAGKDSAETTLRRMVSSLRTSDFAKAKRALKEMLALKKRFTVDQKKAAEMYKTLEDTGNHLIGLVSEQADSLTGADNRLFLRPVETDVAYNSYVQDLKKIRTFLSKYHFAYMKHKVDMLYHLKDKLLVIGSLESLLTLYRQLMAGIGTPMPDIKDVRLYESEVLNRVTFLLEQNAPEIPKILERARDTVKEFLDGRSELEELKGMELQEVTVTEDGQAAVGI